MSAQLPPDPILTTYQYWNWVNVDEATRRQRALDNTYMMFPTVQNNPVSFSKLFFITDAVLTKMANTSYVYSAFINLLSAINIWSGSNTMTIGSSTVTAPIDMNYAPTFLSTQRGYVVSTTITTGSITGASIASLSLTPGLWWIYFSVNVIVGYASGSIVSVTDGGTTLAQSFQNNLPNLYATLKIGTTLSFNTGTKTITFPCGAGGGGMTYNGGTCFAVRMA